ncbi:hypothetical protein [Aquabacterium sp.]|uniref:hypothetical protein n=1 Tax=Aquabacterium sp. TaxID=1872578 RepID=UPI0035C6C52F
MAERPILFSALMVRAILNGSKTQTRRIVKGAALDWLARDGFTPEFTAAPENRLCPHGQPGDQLWVREAWRTAASLDHLSPRAIAARCIDAGYRKPWAPLLYDADGHRNSEWRGFDTPPKVSEPGKGRPSIHMPRWASRITLQITGVRVEQLQDIGPEDAKAEGCHHDDPCDHTRRSCAEIGCPGPDYRIGFHNLWESINGPDSWVANPWVWVIDFKRITP